MRYKKIVGFGDSWVWGDELLDPDLQQRPNAHPYMIQNKSYREQHCFLGLLAKHYNIEQENFAIPGGSLQSTIWNYVWWYQYETVPIDDCLVLVGITHPGRMSFYDPQTNLNAMSARWDKYVHSAWIDPQHSSYSTQWTDLVKKLTVMSDCQELQLLNLQQAMMFFEGRPNTFQFRTSNVPQHITAKNLLFAEHTVIHFLMNLPDCQIYLAPDQHPNELGHQKIAESLISQLDSCIIKGC